jgi:hypothetical protein
MVHFMHQGKFHYYLENQVENRIIKFNKNETINPIPINFGISY